MPLDNPALRAPMLPSPTLRDHYARHVRGRVEGIKPSLRELVLDGLGDLALALAHRPVRRWQGGRDQLARVLGDRWSWPEATAIVELGRDVGLLVPTPGREGEAWLRPLDVGLCNWLGARRIALTRDQDELMDRRLNGGLFDMFALAPSFVDPEVSANLVAIMLDGPGPFEDLLMLGTALAAAAVAWGCEATPAQRAFLTERAMAWTQPMGADWNREVGTALLVLECRRNEEREHLVHLAGELIAEIVSSALGDATVANNPAILATLDTSIAMLLAGISPSAGPDPASVRPPSREALAQTMQSLPRAHAHRVGRALARILPPGPERNGALVLAARLALELGDPRGLAPLEATVAPHDEAAALVDEVLSRHIAAPRDASLIQAAVTGCEALRAWDACPPGVLARAADVVIGEGAPPEVRVEAASALGHHGVRAAASGPFIERVMAAFEDDLAAGAPEPIAGWVGALLHLGSADERLGRLALGLTAGDMTPRMRQLMGDALDRGVRLAPQQMDALVGGYLDLAERPDAVAAMLFLSGVITDTLQEDVDLGPFSSVEPLDPERQGLLLRALASLASQSSDPRLAAEAATACAALMRGDAEFALTLVNLRAMASDPNIKSLYDLAIGACHVFDPQVVERLARDAAQADHEVAAAACVALRLLVETFEQAGRLEPWLTTIHQRVDEIGPHQVPMQQLLVQLATLPLGVDPA